MIAKQKNFLFLIQRLIESSLIPKKETIELVTYKYLCSVKSSYFYFPVFFFYLLLLLRFYFKIHNKILKQTKYFTFILQKQQQQQNKKKTFCILLVPILYCHYFLSNKKHNFTYRSLAQPCEKIPLTFRYYDTNMK